MKVLLFVLLAGYAVRCDDNNYYVIEMPDDALRVDSKHLKVYWNVPTKQCRSKKIPFDNLYEKFGIIQNENDHFRGERVNILYDPGLFPALLKNESSGKFKFRNGGVPQEGDLARHLEAFKRELDQSIPDKEFDGIGIIDFESWRPVYRQNFGVLRPYKDVSYEIERSRHWLWPKKWLEAEAKRRFEESARTFMQTTIALAKQLRARAQWGFYGFPYCFNMASNNMQEACASNVPEENDEMRWLWRESTVLYPSVYSSAELSTAQLTALIGGRVREAARFHDQLLPYFWYRYRDAGFLSQVDLNAALDTFYKSKATGFIIWGSSNDVNTVEKCTKLYEYIHKVMGPAIARYTKPPRRDNSESDIIEEIEETTVKDEYSTTTDNRIKVLDPEYHWIPPENYTQVIKDHVAEEINKKLTNFTKTDDNNSVLDNNVLIDLILNSMFNSNLSNSVENTNKSIVNKETVEDPGINGSLNDSSSSTTTQENKVFNQEELESMLSTESIESFEITTLAERHTISENTTEYASNTLKNTLSDEDTKEIMIDKDNKKTYIQNTESIKHIYATTETPSAKSTEFNSFSQENVQTVRFLDQTTETLSTEYIPTELNDMSERIPKVNSNVDAIQAKSSVANYVIDNKKLTTLTGNTETDNISSTTESSYRTEQPSNAKQDESNKIVDHHQTSTESERNITELNSISTIETNEDTSLTQKVVLYV